MRESRNGFRESGPGQRRHQAGVAVVSSTTLPSSTLSGVSTGIPAPPTRTRLGRTLLRLHTCATRRRLLDFFPLHTQHTTQHTVHLSSTQPRRLVYHFHHSIPFACRLQGIGSLHPALRRPLTPSVLRSTSSLTTHATAARTHRGITSQSRLLRKTDQLQHVNRSSLVLGEHTAE